MQGIHPLVLDILFGRVTTASGVKMRYQLGGFEPDEKFMNDLLTTMTFDGDNVFKVLKECIDKKFLVDMFKNDNLMIKLITFINGFYMNKHIKERTLKIINAISHVRPGIVISFYLRNEKLFKPTSNSFNESMAVFEDIVVKLSSLLSTRDEKYKSKYHKMVMEKYEANWILHRDMK